MISVLNITLSQIYHQKGLSVISGGNKAKNSADHYESTFDSQACNIAVELSLKILTFFSKVLNGKYPDLCLENEKRNKKGMRTTQDILKYIDCNVFPKIISLQHVERHRLSYILSRTTKKWLRGRQCTT